MINETHNDDMLFDRLVDDELSAAERRQLLESLDVRPQGWRRCALAFLEAQSWGNELRQFAGKPQSTAAVAKTSASALPQIKRSTVRTAAQWLAVAASLFVAFRLGSWQHDQSVPIAGDATQSSEQLVSVPPSAAVPDGAKASDALNLWVRDDAGQLRRVRVPLVDARALDQQLGMQFQTGVPDDVRDRLHDRGYTVQSKRQYAPLWLENGRPMVVPVEDTRIVPVSNKVY